MEFHKINNRVESGPWGRTGFLNIPLGDLYESNATNLVGHTYPRLVHHDINLTAMRESASGDIQNLAAHGGILAKDSTPQLEAANGDTDGQLRLEWVASNNNELPFQISLPRNLDTSRDITVYIRGESAGSTDTPTFALDTYFNEGDTKVEDTSSAITAAVVNASATIANADIPAGAQTMSCELTVGAHTTDAIYVYAVWVEYYVLETPGLDLTNGDTDSQLRLRWVASNNDAVVFQTVLPPDFDTNDPLYVKLWADMGGSTDTPTFAADSYFNKGDTKVEDTSEALSDTEGEFVITIAAADIPAAARVFTCELTPGAHTTDALDLMGVWLEYTKLP